MEVAERIKKALDDHQKAPTDPEELARLQEFFQRMKEAGIAKIRDYDLPLPDTIGRALVENEK